MRHFLLIAALLLPLSVNADLEAAKESPAYGKITYKEARAIYDQLKQTVLDTGIFNKKSFEERIAIIKESEKLEQKAKVFGEISHCLTSARKRTDYIRNLHYFANVSEGRVKINNINSLVEPMRSSFHFGEQLSSCFDEVEALDESEPKKLEII